MNMSKIAIVVPVYNVEKYVAECLQSILDQHYQNWECFVVDDGSTDGSALIIEQYVEKDSRFRVLRKRNGGVSSARNFALDMIESEAKRFDFIYFVDSDDRVEPDLYTRLVLAAKADNSDIVVCGFFRLYPNGKRVSGRSLSRQMIGSEEFVELVFSFGKWSATQGSGGYPFKLFRADIIAGIRFVDSRECVEDELFCLEAATRSARISILPECLYVYRQRSGSLVHDSRFALRHQKCRELCIPLAARISGYACLVAVSAYLQTVLNCSKSEGCFTGINRNAVSPEILDRLLDSGLCPKKTVFLYRMFSGYPKISEIYLKARAVFNMLRGKGKRQRQNLFD